MDDQKEKTPPKETEKSFNWWAFVLWPIVMVMLYFLSMGPFLMVSLKPQISWQRQHQYNRFRRTFYGPWYWVYYKTPLHKPLGEYMHFWAPSVFKKDGDANYYVPKAYVD